MTGIATGGAGGSGYGAVGGSDSHLVSLIGLCGTRFDAVIHTIDDLVRELKTGSYEPVDFRPYLHEPYYTQTSAALRAALATNTVARGTLEAGFGLKCLNHACDSTSKVMNDMFGAK